MLKTSSNISPTKKDCSGKPLSPRRYSISGPTPTIYSSESVVPPNSPEMFPYEPYESGISPANLNTKIFSAQNVAELLIAKIKYIQQNPAQCSDYLTLELLYLPFFAVTFLYTSEIYSSSIPQNILQIFIKYNQTFLEGFSSIKDPKALDNFSIDLTEILAYIPNNLHLNKSLCEFIENTSNFIFKKPLELPDTQLLQLISSIIDDGKLLDILEANPPASIEQSTLEIRQIQGDYLEKIAAADFNISKCLDSIKKEEQELKESSSRLDENTSALQYSCSFFHKIILVINCLFRLFKISTQFVCFTKKDIDILQLDIRRLTSKIDELKNSIKESISRKAEFEQAKTTITKNYEIEKRKIDDENAIRMKTILEINDNYNTNTLKLWEILCVLLPTFRYSLSSYKETIAKKNTENLEFKLAKLLPSIEEFLDREFLPQILKNLLTKKVRYTNASIQSLRNNLHIMRAFYNLTWSDEIITPESSPLSRVPKQTLQRTSSFSYATHQEMLKTLTGTRSLPISPIKESRSFYIATETPTNTKSSSASKILHRSYDLEDIPL